MEIQKSGYTKANSTVFVLRQADTCSDTEHATDTGFHRGQKDNIMTEKDSANVENEKVKMVVIMKSIPRLRKSESNIGNRI